MVDIQSANTEIGRGKKERKKEERNRTKNIMSASATLGGHNNSERSKYSFNMSSQYFVIYHLRQLIGVSSCHNAALYWFLNSCLPEINESCLRLHENCSGLLIIYLLLGEEAVA